MKTSILLSTGLLIAFFGASGASQQLAAQEIPHQSDHEQAVFQPLPDYVRAADIDGFSGVTQALFLGRAGIGEYWQYAQGGDTCIGLFYYEDGEPFMSGVCGDPKDSEEDGYSFTSVVQNGDRVVAQAAWFSGNWNPEFSNQSAVIRFASADGSTLSENDDPLSTLFEETTPITVTGLDGKNERVPFLEGEDLTLKTS